MSHSYSPFESLLQRVSESKLTSWDAVERPFIEVVEGFDTEYARGERGSGWYQMKARYFNDLIVALLGNASGQPIAVRSKKKSQLFTQIDIDICWPDVKDPIVAGEVKALGTPPHPKNNNKGRGASSDLHKRAREVAFTSMDIKAAYSPVRKLSSFKEWVDNSQPAYASFWAIRADDPADLDRSRSTLNSLNSYCNGVGAIIYAPSLQSATHYDVKRYQELSIDRALRDLSQRILSAMG